MAVDGLEEKELGGLSFGFDALFRKQQLMKTLDAAIGTTKRGNVPLELHAELFPSCWLSSFTNTSIYEQQG